MKKVLFTVFITICFAGTLSANNLQIGEVTKSNQNTTDKYVMLNFDIMWENSWRLKENISPGNYDAAWVFVKYFYGGGWNHAKLGINHSDHSVSNNTTAEVKAVTDGIGVYVQRWEQNWGSGNFLAKDVKLKWNYGLDEVPDDSIPNLPVIIMGIEMVYVNKEAFSVGDASGNYNTFYQVPDGGKFFTINSESSPIEFKSTGDGNLFAHFHGGDA